MRTQHRGWRPTLPGSARHAVPLLLGLVLLSTALLLFTALNRIDDIKQREARLVEVSALGAASAVASHLEERQRALRLFAEAQAPLFEAIADPARRPGALASIEQRVRATFPGSLSANVNDGRGEPFIRDFDEATASAKHEALNHLSRHPGGWRVLVHPVGGREHFDLLVPVPLGEGTGVFLVSFDAAVLSAVLSEHRLPGYALAVVDRDTPGLIRITPRPEGTTRAQAMEADALSLQPIGSTAWSLAVLAHERPGALEVRQIWRDTLWELALLLLIAAVGLLFLRRLGQRDQAQHRLIEAIARAEGGFIAEADPSSVFDRVLRDLLELTGSDYGFIGEIVSAEDGSPYLRSFSITQLTGEGLDTRRTPEQPPAGLEFRELDSLLGRVITRGEAVISNRPQEDPRGGGHAGFPGVPVGDPPLNSFLGAPVRHGPELVGVVGIANRPRGYDRDLLAYLDPMLSSIGRLFSALRSERLRASAERALRETSVLQQAVLDSTEYAIVATDRHGHILVFNRGAERMLGYRAREMVGRCTPERFHEAEEIVARARELSELVGREIEPGFEVFALQPREQAQAEQREWTYVRKDGSRLPVLLSVTPLHGSDGVLSGYLGIAQDITERKEMERLQTEFIATVSHELRTPLTSIRGSLGLINAGLAGPVSEQARSLLTIAANNSDRLAMLINDILDIEKIESGSMRFDIRPQPLLPVLHEALEASQGYAAQHGVRYSLREPPAGLTVAMDPARIAQVLTNLLSNAAKFSPRESIVEVRVEEEERRVFVHVRDEGCGIAPEFRARIFGKFAQADGSSTRAASGTGLGLSICKAIVEKHGGRIDYASTPGAGSTFSFWLPRSAQVLGLGEPRPPEDPQAPRPRVLHIEDDTDLAAVVRTLLEPRYRLDLAAGPDEARQLLADADYALVLLDLELEGGDGIAVLDALRETSRRPPVLVFSASEPPAARLDEVAGVLIKSRISNELLRSTVDEIIAEHASVHALRRSGAG
jgi:PAS domain S-box-containing protein